MILNTSDKDNGIKIFHTSINKIKKISLFKIILLPHLGTVKKKDAAEFMNKWTSGKNYSLYELCFSEK